tara:strand:- start:58 stop:597 length:540 start_codon:yes stop_codon:yes gene_type:complete
MSNGGNELALQKARWDREDYIRKRDLREKRRVERNRKREAKEREEALKLKQEELQRQSDEKKKQAKLKFTEFTQGIQDKRAQAKDQALKEKQEKAQAVTFKSAYSKTARKYFGSILLLLLNLLAVSISLNCNKDSNLIIKIFLAVLAFFLSIPYLIVHFVRIVIFKKKRCLFNNVEFFI